MTSLGFPTAGALWARQFASQRTAFAIAGRGSVQSDFFPILEYEAPKAFYLGSTAKRILLFDERTWQSEFAPREKQLALSGLSTEALLQVFAQPTINEELSQYLAARLIRERSGSPNGPPADGMICLFRLTPRQTNSILADEPNNEDVKHLPRPPRIAESDTTKGRDGLLAPADVTTSHSDREAGKVLAWIPRLPA